MRITFVSLSKWSKKINGSGLLAYVECSYNQLVGMFDRPTIKTDEYKTNAEWHIEVRHDDRFKGVLSLYDYKEPHSPVDHPDEVIEWHIGGKDIHLALELVDFITTPVTTQTK